MTDLEKFEKLFKETGVNYKVNGTTIEIAPFEVDGASEAAIKFWDDEDYPYGMYHEFSVVPDVAIDRTETTTYEEEDDADEAASENSLPTINILGIDFKVKQVEVIDESNEGITEGKLLYSQGIILLKKSLPLDIKRQVLVHEVVHAILIQIGRNDLSDDETFVQTLAIAVDNTFDLSV